MPASEKLGRKLLDRAGVEVGGSEPWDITIHDDRLWDRVIRDRQLGLGEAYQEGWWDANQLDEFLVKVILADLRSQVRVSPKEVALATWSVARNRQTRRRASENASAHYDIGNDLFEAMLDKRMLYSCAYWRTADDLDSAQEAKLDLICRKLGLASGMRLLDIGCGWGGLAEFAATRYGVDVVGISPAIEQVGVARERCEGIPVTIRQADYREMTGTFDRIVSVGMFEHVGQKNFEAFFKACDRLLAPDGIMLHHTIGSNVTKANTDPWFDRYIFPGGVLPSIASIGKATENIWTIEDLHNLGPDYDRTLTCWYRKVETAWEALPAYDEHFRRTWRYYLLASAAGFRVRDLQLWQLVFSRSNTVMPRYDAPR